MEPMIQNATIRLKFVDDLTIAESISLVDQVKQTDEVCQPYCKPYRERTGHEIDNEKCLLTKHLECLKVYASTNNMKINTEKTKLVMFNKSRTIDAAPKNFKIDNKT